MRSIKALYNSAFSIFQKILEMILSFMFRTILIYTLGKEYLGLSGLFTNIFSLLSLMELGIGSAIVFLMYEPINKKDYNTLNSYLKIYSKFYSTIGILVFIIGISLIPSLPYIINDYELVNINLLPIYVFTLLNVVSSYFLAHRRSLLEADQKIYINSINYSIYNLVGTVLRMFALVLFQNYTLTLIITFILNVISNIRICFITNKMYPFLKKKTKFNLSKQKVKEIYKRMYAASIHQIGNVVITSTDNIVISTYINIATVGIYSNYSMLSTMIYSMFSLIFISITSIVGNMKITESNKKSKDVFDKLFFLNFYLYFITCSIFAALINDFITIWIGIDYLFDLPIVCLITLNLYITGLRNTIVTFINSSGLNYQTRYKSIFEVIINLTISIILAKSIGVIGVIIGTIVSFILVSVWYEPYILFKYWFKKGLLQYYIKYLCLLLLTVICSMFLIYINSLITKIGLFIFLLECIIDFLILNIIIFLLFRQTNEYNYYLNYLLKCLNKVLKLLKFR